MCAYLGNELVLLLHDPLNRAFAPEDHRKGFLVLEDVSEQHWRVDCLSAADLDLGRHHRVEHGLHQAPH
jgi:hypothetical protein